jgi:hypothetical protein
MSKSLLCIYANRAVCGTRQRKTNAFPSGMGRRSTGPDTPKVKKVEQIDVLLATSVTEPELLHVVLVN